jgi:hypothetical protein
VQQDVRPPRLHELYCGLWRPAVFLHEVAADEGRATRPARLAVHVHGRTNFVDEADAAEQLFLQRYMYKHVSTTICCNKAY